MQSVTGKVRPVPQEYASVAPYLIVDGVPRLIDFLKHTFDEEERALINDREGHVGHAEIKIGGSIVMIADSPRQYSPIPSHLYVYGEDVDHTHNRGVEAARCSEQVRTTQ